jgi:CheY-like chemotaxis protein/DNA-directed RNA polymerase specialized sigma24 family protein
MSIAREIAPQLPLLRRFARALSGSQASGDAYVAATLEVLIADPSHFSRDIPGRQALYKTFVQLWSSTNDSRQRQPPEPAGSAVDRHLDALTPLPRQAFLLRTIEGFTIDETALILGKSVQETAGLIDVAGREIAEQVATTVLIIEDEPIIALDIESIVRDLGHEVAGIARTYKEAVTLAADREPGLVLADIQLADGSSGLDAVNDILLQTTMPVIFITAFPERLLTGEKPEPAFLITKPFQPEAVKAAISQALFFDRRAGHHDERGAA